MKNDRYQNYYDIVILPSEDIRDFAITTSRDIARTFESALVLGKRTFKPHISLYHVAIKKKNLAEMLHRIRAIAAHSAVAESLSISAYPHMPHLRASRPKWFVDLHIRIVREINPLRDTSYPNTWHDPRWYTPKAVYEKNIQQWGSPIVGRNLFDPHITLTVLNEPSNNRAAAKLIPKQELSFTPKAITVCQIGPHHSCQRVVARIPFHV